MPLGPAHALHAAIERDGGGRYSHWNGALLFSSSDGSDPNVNGRQYRVSFDPRMLGLLGFGSCHLYDALASLRARDLANCPWTDPGLSYSPRETLQLIDFHHGRLEIPAPLQALALSTMPGPNTLSAVARGADVLFLEVGTPIDIAYGPLWIMRTQLLSTLLHPIQALGRAARRVANRWYYQGLIKQDEAARRDCAEQLLELIPQTELDPGFAGDVFKNARGCTQEADAVAHTINAIRDSLQPKAVCALSAHNVFTADGRPLAWPGNFPKQLEAICRGLGIPLLHPSRLVAERGVSFSLEADLYHFTPQFLALLGDEMLAMARRALGASAGKSMASPSSA